MQTLVSIVWKTWHKTCVWMSTGESALRMSFLLLLVWLPRPWTSLGRAELRESLEKGVMKTTATDTSKDKPSFPWELHLNGGCPTGLCYSPRCIPSSVCAQPLPWPLGWHPSLASSWPAHITGPWLTLVTVTRPDLTSQLDHGPAPSSQSCTVTTGLGGHGCPQQDWPQPWEWLSPTAWPRPCHATTAIAVSICVTGDRPWWPGPVLPAPWGATVGSHHGPSNLKKEEIHSVPYRQALPNLTHPKRFFLLPPHIP